MGDALNVDLCARIAWKMKPLGGNPRGWPRRRRCWRGHNGTAVDPVVPLHGLKDRTECSKLENHSSVNSVGDQMASSEGRERWGTTSTGCKAIRNSIQRALQTSRASKQSKEKKKQRGPGNRRVHALDTSRMYSALLQWHTGRRITHVFRL